MTPIYLTRVSSLSKKSGRISILFILAFLLNGVGILSPISEGAGEDRVFAVVQTMESAFKTVENYTCEVEQIFYHNGEESQRFRFKFFKKEKKIRVDFSHPYSSLSIFYGKGDKEAMVMPFRFFRTLKFRLSIDNPMIQTPTGQRLNQTDMEHFLEFLSKNLQKVKQKGDEFQEDRDQIRFWLWAMDYIHGKDLEKYRISILKQNWLPTRIERYHLEGKILEVSMIWNYVTNTRLDDKYFVP